MSYTALSDVNVGELFDEDDFAQLKANFEAGIPAIFTAEGQIAAGTGSQAVALVAASGNKQVLVADSSESAGMKFAGGLIEVGMIIIWSGSAASIPSGWVLCDGANGTPDLRGRFVIGAGGGLSVNDSGGSNIDLSHTHTPNAAAADSADWSHTHTQGNTGISTGNHKHALGTLAVANNTLTVDIATGSTMAPTSNHNHAFSGTETGTEGAHTHTNPSTGTSGAAHVHTIGETESDLATSNLPPYYALCFIQRLS